MGQGAPSEAKASESMLEAIGVESIQELFADIPEAARLGRELRIPGPLAEWELLAQLRRMASKNVSSAHATHFLGAGCYDHHVFAAVRSLVGRGEFFTAYTPYQPELSQGTLQAMFEFQTYVCRITGMEVANSSMYDGATALAEAVLMAQRIQPGKRRVVMSAAVHPEYRAVVRTITAPLGLEILDVEPDPSWSTDWEATEELINEQTSCVVLQNPNFFGTIEELDGFRRVEERIHALGGMLVAVVVETTSLGLLKPPGELGADIVVGEGQPLGLPMAFGGPHLGLFATKGAFLRQMPGRLVGQAQDSRGQRGYVLTLATREQHIRRERATSNICTNQSLCALAMTIHLALLGPQGLRALASRCTELAHQAMETLAQIPGLEIPQSRVYNEFVVRTPVPPRQLNGHLLGMGMVGGVDLGQFCRGWNNNWLLCFTEKHTMEDIQRLAGALREILG